MLVYVVNPKGKPLMPCSPCRAKKLLENNKAKVICRCPFIIRLLYGSAGYRQPITMGVDSGSKEIGFAATANGKILYASEVKTRKDVHKKMVERASYRRTRRSRKCRYREKRFDNRKRKEGWLTPTMRSKVHSHLKEISFIKKILPISQEVIETASFDIHKITNPQVEGTGYQNGSRKDFYNVKQFVLFRDGHTCQKCLQSKPVSTKQVSKNPKLHVHHIVFKSHGGTDSPDNLITLCDTCHDKLHDFPEAEKQSLKLQKKRKVSTTDAVQVSTIGAYLKKSLDCIETFGYETKYKRELLGLKKEHYIDAVCICLHEGSSIQLPSHMYKKVSIPRGNYQQTSGKRSEQPLPTHKIMGYRKYDKVLWNDQEAFIKGRMSTGYAILMDIEEKTIAFKPLPKFKTMQRISARKSCLTALKSIENSPSNIEKSCYQKKDLVYS